MFNEKAIQEVKMFIKELNSGAYPKEDNKRHLFSLKLFKIFEDVENKSKLFQFAKGSESLTKITTNENRIKSGFQDVDLGTNTLEWKADLTKNDEKLKGQKQLREYISGKWNKNGYTEIYKGILSDGLIWIAYTAKCRTIKDQYTEDDVELCEIESIVAKNENDSEFIYNFIYKYLILENKLVINPNVLQQIFGENSDINKECIGLIKTFIDSVIVNDESIVKYIKMWNLYKQYNIDITDDESLYMYAQNLYLVLLTRILVAKLLEMDNSNVDDRWIKEIIDGTKFINNFKIKNFVQQDMYYWILDKKYIGKFIEVAKKLYLIMAEYDFINTNKDNLLHLIYEEIIPKSHRKKYGQKSTDFRLCDNIVDRLENQIEVGKKYIEPAIGSGSIERSVIINLRAKMDSLSMGPDEQLLILQKDVVGIDIDPIAVILAKSQWIITNSDLIKQSRKSIEIPIYHADSLFNNSYTGDNFEHIGIRLEKSQPTILINKKIINNISVFDRYLNDCDNLAKSLLKTNQDKLIIKDEHVKFVNKYIIEEDSVETKLFIESTKRIIEYLINKRREINNELWKGLLFNNNIPQLLFKAFDMIIGNLPWLALSSLSQLEYTNELKELSVHYKIRATESSHHHQEIATVFALRCIDKFLKSDGIAAFVMPGTIISGDHHTLFRKKNFSKVVDVQFYELWYIPNDINPFDIKACVLFMRKGNNTTNFEMRKLNSLSKWKDTSTEEISLLVINNKNTWTVNNGQYIDIDNYYAEQFKQGADLMPRTAVFIQTSENIDEYDEDDDISIWTDDYALNNKNGKKLKGRLFTGVIKKKYIFTTTISEMLLPYHICSYTPKIALPININSDNEDGIEKINFVYDEEFAQEGDSLSAAWFNQFDELKEFEKKSFREYLNVRNKLLDQNYFNAKYLVHMGASGKYPCAAVQELESNMRFIADQTTYVAEIYDEDEAYYIVAMLNSRYISKAIEDFQAEGAFDKRHIHKIPFIFIPRFDSENPIHLKISKLSKELSNEIKESITEKESSIEFGLSSRRSKLKKKYSEKIATIDNIIENL